MDSNDKKGEVKKNGFLKLSKDDVIDDMIKFYPFSFILITVIARRAKRTQTLSLKGLEIGEALIGDYKNYGMTRQQYRTALDNLQEWGFVTIKATNKGTVVKLINSTIYDINPESDNHQANHQTTNQLTIQQPLTKKVRSKEGNNNPPIVPLEGDGENGEKSSEKKKRGRTAKMPEYTPEFEEYWKEYPRKEGKAEAFVNYQAWIKAGKTHEDLKVSAINYANTCEIDKREKIKMGGPFLSLARPRFVDFLPENYTPPQPPSPSSNTSSSPSSSTIQSKRKFYGDHITEADLPILTMGETAVRAIINSNLPPERAIVSNDKILIKLLFNRKGYTRFKEELGKNRISAGKDFVLEYLAIYPQRDEIPDDLYLRGPTWDKEIPLELKVKHINTEEK